MPVVPAHQSVGVATTGPGVAGFPCTPMDLTGLLPDALSAVTPIVIVAGVTGNETMIDVVFCPEIIVPAETVHVYPVAPFTGAIEYANAKLQTPYRAPVI